MSDDTKFAARSFLQQLVANESRGDNNGDDSERQDDGDENDGQQQDDDGYDPNEQDDEQSHNEHHHGQNEDNDDLYNHTQQPPEQLHSERSLDAYASQSASRANLREEEENGEVTEARMKEWKEMFALFDFDHTGFISTSDLGTILRGLGHNLTESTINTFINSYDSNGSGRIDFTTFHTLMQNESPMPAACTEKQVVEDFHVFDIYRDGTIPVVDLVHLLRNLGEPLTRDDVDHLLQEIAIIDGDNKCNIRELVRHMMRTSAPTMIPATAAGGGRD